MFQTIKYRYMGALARNKRLHDSRAILVTSTISPLMRKVCQTYEVECFVLAQRRFPSGPPRMPSPKPRNFVKLAISVNSTMYNLIVAAQEDAWLGAPYELEKGRAVSAGEYTDEVISKRLGTLDAAACAELQTLPALFAYETQNKKDARLGIIKRIRSRHDEVRIEYEILTDLPVITNAEILRLQWEFHVSEWEMNRTHWAVKNVDLISELQEAGILTGKQAKIYLAKLGSIPPPIAPTSTGGSLLKENVVVSYSHKDKKFLDELLTHIKPLQRDGRVSVWSDKQIKPGSEWAAKIDEAFAGAKVALLLVTKDFLASDFIHERELGLLLKRAKNEGVVILWVLVRDCNWKKTPIAELQAAYPTDKPLAQLNFSRDSAWVKICDKLEGAANASASTTPVAQLNVPASPTGQGPLTLHAKGYYIEKVTGRNVCGLCWEKHSLRITLLDHRKDGPTAAGTFGGTVKGYASWTEMLKCPHCGTEYAPVHKNRDF